jgi:chaperonin GroEL
MRRVVVARVLEGQGNVGYDTAADGYGDILELGVVDPTKAPVQHCKMQPL